MPLLFAGGAGLEVAAVLEEAVVAAGVTGAAAEEFEEAGAAFDAGADFVAGVAAVLVEAVGAGADVVEAAGVAESAEVDFFERRDFLAGVASAADFASAVGAEAEASVDADFLDLDDGFFDVEVDEVELSAAAAESAVSDFFERVFDFGFEEVSAVADVESLADESDFADLDFDFELLVLFAVEESEPAVLEDCVESSAAAFFFDLDFDLGVLVSDWSDCCDCWARTAIPPKVRSAAMTTGKKYLKGCFFMKYLHPRSTIHLPDGLSGVGMGWQIEMCGWSRGSFFRMGE